LMMEILPMETPFQGILDRAPFPSADVSSSIILLAPFNKK